MPPLTRLRIGAGLVSLIGLAVLATWSARRPIAQGALARALAARGVPATYRIANIGFRWERLENIVIGDPRRPDLTADWAEVRLAAGLGGVRATAIRAGGVRLRGQLMKGRVNWGVIDRLLPKTTGGPFALPDLDVDLNDARVGLATPYGAVGARLDGQGNLADGFRGKLAITAPRFAVGTCAAEGATAYVDLAISNRRPSISGPLRAPMLLCGSARIQNAAIGIDATLSRALDAWQGKADVAVGQLATSAARMAALHGSIAFSGTGQQTSGSIQLRAGQAQTGATRLAGIALDGRFGLRGSITTAQGTMAAARINLDSGYAHSARAFAQSVAGTPAAPLAARLADAAARASRGVSAKADFAARSDRAGLSAVVTQLAADAPGGARLRLAGGQGIRLGAVGLLIDTRIALAGGGFPSVAASFQRTATGATRGIARITPYSAGGARLALDPLRFAATPYGGIRIDTSTWLDGPLSGGRVAGLRFPVKLAIDRSGGLAGDSGCIPVAFSALELAGARFAPAAFVLCPTGKAVLSVAGGRLAGGGTIAAPRLSGRLGGSPFALTASRAAFALASRSFAVAGLDARAGIPARVTHVQVGALDGRFGGNDLAGSFARLAGQIGNVPLLIDQGAGRWALSKSVLTLDGQASVADAARPARFNPMAADAVKFRLASGRIDVTGLLREPRTRAAVAHVAITHDLSKGVGQATLDVADLAFGKALQPEVLTPLTLGVVANVRGSVAGQGRIAWTPAGVTSTGRFATKDVALAAAFGPVTGLSGDIVFTDLLGLVTAPGQVATVASINPGIPVLDGRIAYHLALGQRIVVEGGRWPFAGGVLVLDPTTLDMGVTRERRLTFRVEGLDAAKFVEQLKFENLAATGIFDGSIPMIFDADGGRVEGGRIIARKGGGTLAYVGEVSNAKMNVFAKLAFDALKAIRYQNLTIGLDGPLDGEMVSKVDFRGVNESPLAPPKSFLARQFVGLPFKFNITIRAPFRGLLSTARTFQDPSLLFHQLKPPVQPAESEKRP